VLASTHPCLAALAVRLDHGYRVALLVGAAIVLAAAFGGEVPALGRRDGRTVLAHNAPAWRGRVRHFRIDCEIDRHTVSYLEPSISLLAVPSLLAYPGAAAGWSSSWACRCLARPP
jgi:hypothetical protein